MTLCLSSSEKIITYKYIYENYRVNAVTVKLYEIISTKIISVEKATFRHRFKTSNYIQ